MVLEYIENLPILCSTAPLIHKDFIMINGSLMHTQGMKNNLSHKMSYHLVSSGDSILLWPSNKCKWVTGSLATFLVRPRKIQWNSNFLKSVTKPFSISGLNAIMEWINIGAGGWSARTTQLSLQAFHSGTRTSALADHSFCSTLFFTKRQSYVLFPFSDGMVFTVSRALPVMLSEELGSAESPYTSTQHAWKSHNLKPFVAVKVW